MIKLTGRYGGTMWHNPDNFSHAFDGANGFTTIVTRDGKIYEAQETPAAIAGLIIQWQREIRWQG